MGGVKQQRQVAVNGIFIYLKLGHTEFKVRSFTLSYVLKYLLVNKMPKMDIAQS